MPLDTQADNARLRSLVDHARKLGCWIRSYTLDGFAPAVRHEQGWLEQYNFGSLAAASDSWQAAALMREWT